MDKVSHYREVIKGRLSELAQLVNRVAHPGVETLCAFDDEHGQYLLLKTGWAGGRRVRGATLYLRLRDDKVWVEEDWTEDGIATDLVKSGVPPEDIVPAFHPADVRPYTEYAAV